jgi:molybdenum cofactor cytidylyltransferase
VTDAVDPIRGGTTPICVTREGGLPEALGLGAGPALVSIVGGGGKSSLMFALGGELPGRVVMTTTTRIFAAQMKLAMAVCTLADEAWRERLEGLDTNLLIVGRVEGDRAVGVPVELPAQLLTAAGVDWVVVEADGSRMRPVKAPADHEPVVPAETDLLVLVVGIDALAGPIREVAHRPERVSAVAGLAPDQVLTPETLATLLTSTRGGLKDVPGGARVVVVLNKVESPADLAAARAVATAVLAHERVERVLIGALRKPRSGWEVCGRDATR